MTRKPPTRSWHIPSESAVKLAIKRCKQVRAEVSSRKPEPKRPSWVGRIWRAVRVWR